MGVSVPSGGAAADSAPKEALLAGYRAAQWFCFAFVMVGLALALLFLRNIGVIARKHVEEGDLAEASPEERAAMGEEERNGRGEKVGDVEAARGSADSEEQGTGAEGRRSVEKERPEDRA